jgi:predicted phage-related endonuclease
MGELVVERERGTSDSGQIPTRAMQFGIDEEDNAIALFEMLYNDCEPVERCGFLAHPELDYIGASPDFLLPNAVGEVKCCYKSEYHEETRVYGMPKRHVCQVQTQMFVTGKPKCVFLSYDPRAEPAKQLYRQIVQADAAYHEKIRARAAEFWEIFSRGERPQAELAGIPQLF